MEPSKNFIKSLKSHGIEETQVFLKRIHDGSLPPPLQMFRISLNHSQRSFKKLPREKVEEFTPFLEKYGVRPYHFILMLAPAIGWIWLTFSILRGYIAKYIELYAVGTEEVHIGDVNKSGKIKERTVLYDCLSPATEEEILLIRKKQKIKIIILIVGTLLYLAFYIFLFLINRRG